MSSCPGRSRVAFLAGGGSWRGWARLNGPGAAPRETAFGKLLFASSTVFTWLGHRRGRAPRPAYAVPPWEGPGGEGEGGRMQMLSETLYRTRSQNCSGDVFVFFNILPTWGSGGPTVCKDTQRYI